MWMMMWEAVPRRLVLRPRALRLPKSVDLLKRQGPAVPAFPVFCQKTANGGPFVVHPAWPLPGGRRNTSLTCWVSRCVSWFSYAVGWMCQRNESPCSPYPLTGQSHPGFLHTKWRDWLHDWISSPLILFHFDLWLFGRSTPQYFEGSGRTVSVVWHNRKIKPYLVNSFLSLTFATSLRVNHICREVVNIFMLDTGRKDI